MTHYRSRLLSVILLCALAAFSAWAPPASAQSANVNAEKPGLDGWIHDTELQGIGIDRYRSASGSMTIDLMAFPNTDLTASEWIAGFIPIMVAPDERAGNKVHVINDDELGSESVKGAMGSSSENADIATRTVMVRRATANNRSTLMLVRAILRKDQPVQASIMRLGEADASAEEKTQATRIRYEARMPVNNSAAFLGLDAMIGVMTEPLIYPTDATQKRSASNADQQSKKNPLRKASTTSEPSLGGAKANSHGNSVPAFPALPGPRVKLTGKLLGRLPAGYRFEGRATNYWTNKAMTATRSIHLTLTEDGQFEWANFSVTGGTGGVTGTITASDKKGSIGTVYGSTNPSGAGAESVALTKRDGLDPTKYGTYYIAGNEIEFRYANGSLETRSFKTDGYKLLLLNNKKYFVSTPDRWERRNAGKVTLYRSLDGIYSARVSYLKGNISSASGWLQKYLDKLKGHGLLDEAGQIRTLKVDSSRYKLAKAAVRMRQQKGAKAEKLDLYFRNGRSNHRVIELYHGGNSLDEARILEFIRQLN